MWQDSDSISIGARRRKVLKGEKNGAGAVPEAKQVSSGVDKLGVDVEARPVSVEKEDQDVDMEDAEDPVKDPVVVKDVEEELEDQDAEDQDVDMGDIEDPVKDPEGI